VSRVRHNDPAPEVRVEDGRWVLGNPVATCAKCGAPAAVNYAANGKAEFWHAPTDCCDWSRARERRFDAMARADDARTEALAEAAQMGWRGGA
jgi:hypothetical protein